MTHTWRNSIETTRCVNSRQSITFHRYLFFLLEFIRSFIYVTTSHLLMLCYETIIAVKRGRNYYLKWHGGARESSTKSSNGCRVKLTARFTNSFRHFRFRSVFYFARRHGHQRTVTSSARIFFASLLCQNVTQYVSRV